MGAVCSTPKESSPTTRVANVKEEEFPPNVQNAEQYSYEELRTATDSFNQEKVIGKGGFGSVFKGRLNDGRLVAIKVLSAQSEQGMPEFLKEIDVLSSVKHVNLVELYGSCTEGDHRMLVYGYLEKNSLAQTLLGEHCNKSEFSWEIRSRICMGVAEALAFLHEEAEPRIVHRDIKASNVLLDEDFTPKISDFGLARLFPNSKTHISTLVRGTYGYLAPEYVLTGRLTPKADIFSFGVLLLQIVSGIRYTPEEQFLPVRAWKLYKRGKLAELVDKALKGDSCTAEACKYLKIGLLCAQERPAKRPAMSGVAQMLKGAIDVDNMEIPKPIKLMALLGLTSSSCEPRAPLLGSCFWGN